MTRPLTEAELFVEKVKAQPAFSKIEVPPGTDLLAAGDIRGMTIPLEMYLNEVGEDIIQMCYVELHQFQKDGSLIWIIDTREKDQFVCLCGYYGGECIRGEPIAPGSAAE